MKKFPLLLFFVLFLAFAASARTIKISSCPAFDVTGGESVMTGEIMTFTATIENYDLSKLSFNWIISGAGEILEGQGTLSIKVLKKNNDENVTATIEIKGLPEGCPMVNSETAATFCPSPARLIDEFSIPASRIEKARLDNLVEEVGETPDSQIYVIEYFKRGTSQKVINRKIRKITDYLVEKWVAKDRFTILTADSEDGQNRTMFWIVPPGASVPQP